ncbi:MAG: hypothetical protein R3B70_19910 [Polyangiaceae bacterium]
MDEIETLIRPIWARNKLSPASAAGLEHLRALGMPEVLVRHYSMGDGGGADGVVFYPSGTCSTW